MERKNYTVAVDLGSSSVVVAVGSKGAEGTLDVACVVSKPVEGVHAGKIENIERVSDDEPRKSADVIDLTELLKRSLGAKAGKKPAKTPSKPAPTKKPRKAAGD